jgi:hypothetical protein
MLRFARFALLLSLSVAMPGLFALDPPQKQNQDKQQTQDRKKNVERVRKDVPSTDGTSETRLGRRGSRMTERNRQIDGIVNKPKK